MLIVLPVAHLVQVPGWAYLYALPILAVAYAVFRTASHSAPSLEKLYLEIARREALAGGPKMADRMSGSHQSLTQTVEKAG
jgi:hypothetical protein